MIRLTIIAILQVASSFATAAEIDVLDVSVGTVSTSDWEVTGLRFALELSESGLRGTTQISRIRLLTSGQSFENINVACDLIGLTNLAISCESAAFTATVPGAGRQTVQGAFVYETNTGFSRIKLSRVVIAGGATDFDIVLNDSGIDVAFDSAELQLDQLLSIARDFGFDLATYAAIGNARMKGRLQASAAGLKHLELWVELDGASITNESGTIATDNLQGRVDMDLTVDDAVVRFGLGLESGRGEAYLEPVYANFSEHAMRLQAEHVTTEDFTVFDVSQFDLQQDTLLSATGRATITLPQDKTAPISLSANIELDNTSVATLYSSFVQVGLAGSILGDLDTAGRVSGSIAINNNALASAKLRLDRVILDDRGGRFGIYGLDGQVDWPGTTMDTAGSSHLQWDSGLVHNIIIDSGAAEFRLGDNDVELLAPLRLPTMGGALTINQLTMHDYGTASANGVLDAELEPIQIGQLAGAFGWPAFSGTLSGQLPLLQLEGDTATIGGALSARAFDGDIEVTKLRIEQPFGQVPRLQGDIRLRGLDLQRVTDTFSFGVIQGRLSGDVAGLEMVNWRPVAMDMHFYTPVGDKSQRRISQRAVENLANVGGGGAAAVLSSGFLKFFDVFSYEQIALRCLLRDGVCSMSGAGRSEDRLLGEGYYIVKGSGLPRIDVVGYRNQVSWPRLVRQLAAIAQGNPPTLN